MSSIKLMVLMQANAIFHFLLLGLSASLIRSQGGDINGACDQLRAKRLKEME